MNDNANYLIQIQGQTDIHDLNALSPLEIKSVRMDGSTTLFEVCTDQSGMVGLLRHLHARGFTFLSITFLFANREDVTRFHLNYQSQYNSQGVNNVTTDTRPNELC